MATTSGHHEAVIEQIVLYASLEGTVKIKDPEPFASCLRLIRALLMLVATARALPS
jgi:hypothetical protein